MTEKAATWDPVPDINGIDGPFGSVSFAYEPHDRRSIVVTMHGKRNLHLRFTGAIALRFEDDYPGFDPLPHPLPMLRPGVTIPLLKIEHSHWLNKWHPVHAGLAHFALLSLDDLVQLIAKPNVEAHWG